MCVHMYACVCACVCARSCVCTLICVHGKCIYRGPQAAEARLIHMGGNVRRRRQAQTGLSHQPRETELCMQCMGVYLKKKILSLTYINTYTQEALTSKDPMGHN